jgi:galactose mutarotase-like enzyme
VLPVAGGYAADLIAFEPMTAPTNALITGGPELTVIGAGEEYEAAFEIRVAQISDSSSVSGTTTGRPRWI